MTFSSFYSPMGLDVWLLEPGALMTTENLSVESITVGLETTADGQTAVYVNSKTTPWESLTSSITEELKIHSKRTAFIQAGRNVRWADVAKAIDAVKIVSADVVLLANAPNIDSSHTRRSRKAMK